MNKKLIIAAALCGLAFGSRAQTEKGNFLLGGGLNFKSEKIEGDTPPMNSFGFGPQVGYFISNDFAIGLSSSYQYGKRKAYSTQTQVESETITYHVNGSKTEGFSIAPFVRYYLSLNTKFKFFGGLSVNFSKYIENSIAEHMPSLSSKLTTRMYGINLSPGFAFFPTKKLAIEFSTNMFSYQKTKTDLHGNGTSYAQNAYLYFGLTTIQPSVGINYHF